VWSHPPAAHPWDSGGVIEVEDTKTLRPWQFGFEPSSFCMWGQNPRVCGFPTAVKATVRVYSASRSYGSEEGPAEFSYLLICFARSLRKFSSAQGGVGRFQLLTAQRVQHFAQ
jgi:hypothetical protein